MMTAHNDSGCKILRSIISRADHAWRKYAADDAASGVR